MTTQHIATLRTFQDSATARAAGFSTIQWLRAFSFNEHAAHIERARVMNETAWED